VRRQRVCVTAMVNRRRAHLLRNAPKPIVSRRDRSALRQHRYH
jgi:hypothetical protein